MKKILGLALGITMISLTPAVGNAAGMIEAKCQKKGKYTTFIFDISGGKQTIAEIGEADIKFTEDTIIAKVEKGSIIWKFKEKKVINTKGRELPINCKYKNLELIKQALLNQNKKPAKAKNKPSDSQIDQQEISKKLDRILNSLYKIELKLNSKEKLDFQKNMKKMRD